MDYVLAKELKDAGFPQGRWDGEDDYVPTLEELIEACTSNRGGNFALHQNKRDDEQQWCAWLINSMPSGENPHDRTYDLKMYGRSPDEAAARLWIALNKK